MWIQSITYTHTHWHTKDKRLCDAPHISACLPSLHSLWLYCDVRCVLKEQYWLQFNNKILPRSVCFILVKHVHCTFLFDFPNGSNGVSTVVGAIATHLCRVAVRPQHSLSCFSYFVFYFSIKALLRPPPPICIRHPTMCIRMTYFHTTLPCRVVWMCLRAQKSDSIALKLICRYLYMWKMNRVWMQLWRAYPIPVRLRSTGCRRTL